MRLLVRWLFASAALAAAAWVVPGIRVEGSAGLLSLAAMAVVLGLLNATLKPILVFLGCGFVAVTLGVGMLFINGLVFWAAGQLVPGFSVDGYWPAFWGAIVVSVVSWLLSALVSDEGSRPCRRASHRA